MAIGLGAGGQAYIAHLARGANATSNSLINDGILLTLALYAAVAALIAGYRRWMRATLRWHEGDPVASVGAGLVRGLLMGGAVTAIVHAATGHAHGDDRFSGVLAEDNPLRTFFVVGLAVVVAPLVEETLFRGILFESWRGKGKVALVLSGFAFAAWHLNGSAIVYYWLIGLALGRIYARRGLVGSMTAHATFNAVVMAVTIASISGSGHTYTLNGLRVHTPPTWHQSKVKATTGDLLLEGPSGSSFFLDANREHTHPFDANEQDQIAREDMQSFLDRRGLTTSPTPVQFPLGPGYEVHITDGRADVRVDVVATAMRTYVFVTDPASSQAATKQTPGILASAHEN